MTYLREMQRLLKAAAAIAIAGCGFFAAPAHALNVTLSGCSGTQFAYQTIAVDASGNVTINCTATAGPGTVGFASPNTYSANVGQQVAVNVSRTGGTAGAVGANLSVTGGCTLSAASVSFPDGDGTNKSVNVIAPGSTTTCTVNLAVTGGAVQGTSSATVNVLDPNVPGTFAFSASQSGPAINTDFAFQIQRTGGSNGGYDVPFSLAANGTAATILEASPIRFNAGETTKTLTLRTGATAGSVTVSFGTPVPVAPNTTATTAGGPITITISSGTTGSCGALPSNVILLPDIPAGEGQWILANADQGQIASARLPSLPSGLLGGVITQTSTQGTGPIGNIEMSFSKCPGDFNYYTQQPRVGGSYFPCYTSSSFITNNSIRWHLTVNNHYAYCYAPVSEGPWYVNVRYTMPNGCPYGNGNCGASLQWNRP